MDNFTPIRNGLSDHIKAGWISPFDLGVYLFLHMHADWATGIYSGCALTIAYAFQDLSLKEHIQKSLRRLRDQKYINYRRGDGSRGGYPILLNKYEPRIGELSGSRLNAWKHGELVQPEYEPRNCGGTVKTLSRNCDDSVMAPIQEVKELQEAQEVKRAPAANAAITEPKAGSVFLSSPQKKKPVKTPLPENFGISDEIRRWASEKGYTRLEKRLEHFVGWARARGARYADWDQAFQNSVRDDWAKLNRDEPVKFVSLTEQTRRLTQ
jgi:hypothetical protein